MSDNKQPAGVLRSLDWWTIGIYLALLSFGWISVCGASYTYGDNDIFSLGARSGMQIVDWHFHRLGLCYPDDGRQVFRYLLVCHLWRADIAALCHDIQSAQHQGFAFLAGSLTAPTAACRVW